MTAAKMHAEAIDHSWRYLLPRRFRRGDPETDRLYEVAQELVDGGYARWIESYSDLAPGIRLTTKPFPS